MVRVHRGPPCLTKARGARTVRACKQRPAARPIANMDPHGAVVVTYLLAHEGHVLEPARRRARLRKRWRDVPWMVLHLGRAGGGRAVGVLSVWTAWERLTMKRHRIQPIRPGGLLRFRIDFHRGSEHRLVDGTLVHRHDPIIELHLDNRGLLAMREGRGYSTWRAVHALRMDLAALGARLTAGEFGRVVAVHGVSLMGAAGGLLGFETHELPHTLKAAFQRYFLTGLDAVYHPAGLDRLDSRARGRWPVEVWMSSERLIALTATR